MPLNPERVDALVDRMRREVESGVLPACQMAVGLDGEIAVTTTIGAATDDTRFAVFSATKALIAATVWQLMARGALSPSDRVVDHFAEFGANDKESVTIEHLLTHTAGFPHAPLGPPDWYDRDARIGKMASWRARWEPGTHFEYHPTAAHWVLGEVIARITGGEHTDAVRDLVLRPLGLTRLQLGVPRGEGGDVAELVATGAAPTGDELSAVFGVAEYDLGEVTPEALLLFNSPEVRELGVPGAGAVSTAADLARFYQALLHNPGVVFDETILRDATGTIRCTLPDPILRTPANRTLGLIAAGHDGTSAFRGMGHNVSPGAFGHNGAGGQIAWADPATGISLAYVTSGIDRNFLREARRVAGLSSRAALLTQE